MRVRLWRGYHGPAAREAIGRAWETGDPLILCPPGMGTFDFLRWLPHDGVELCGDWQGLAPELPPYDGGAPGFPSSPIFGLFTTGTTRETPKLVLYSRRNVESSLDGILSFFDETRIRKLFCYPQPSHTFGLTLGYLLAAWKRLDLVTGEGKYGRHHHEAWLSLEDEGVLTLGTPTHFEDLLRHVGEWGATPRPTYSAILGGAAVSAGLWRRVRDELNIVSPSVGYGATEACPGVTHLPPGREPRQDGEIGVELPQLELEIHSDRLEARGESVCLATCENGRWEVLEKLVLKDRVERREDGILVFSRRSDLILNRGGEKFSLEQIESALRDAHGVNVIAVALPDPRLGEELGLVVQGAPARNEIYATLERVFGRRFDRSRYETQKVLPINTNGKPDRAAAKGLLPARSAFPVGVRHLTPWVPHRPPMVWVKEVLWADPGEGECSIDPSMVPATPGRWIEWMAQAYAYSQAALQFTRREAAPLELPRMLLAGLTNLEIRQAPADSGKDWRVLVRCSKTLGPVSLVDASVVTGNGTLLAAGKLKLYSNASLPERSAPPAVEHRLSTN